MKQPRAQNLFKIFYPFMFVLEPQHHQKSKKKFSNSTQELWKDIETIKPKYESNVLAFV